MSDSRIYVDGTNQYLRTIEQETPVGAAHVEVVAIADPTAVDMVAAVMDTIPDSNVAGMVVRTAGIGMVEGADEHASPLTARPLAIGGYSSLLPPSATADGDMVVGWYSPNGEAYTTNSQQELNVFAAYGKTVTSDGTTYVCLIDKSDTTNWPHDETGRLDICQIIAQVDKSSNAQGSVSMGVITRVDGTDADVVLFAGITFTNADTTHIEFFRNYYPSQLKLSVSGGNVTTMATSAKLTNIAAINTATPMDSFLGTGTVTPAVGDVILRYVKTAGTTITASMQALYHGET